MSWTAIATDKYDACDVQCTRLFHLGERKNEAEKWKFEEHFERFDWIHSVNKI